MTQRCFTLNFIPFEIDILVCLGGSREKAIKKYLKLINYTDVYDIPPNPRSHGYVFSMNNIGCVIWLHEEAWAGVVAHEVFHAVYCLLTSRQIPLTDETEEVYAYAINWLFNQIVTKLPVYKNCDKCLKKRKK